MDYFEREELSRSDLRDVLASPKIFHARKILKQVPNKRSAAMEFGRKVHLALNEPQALLDHCIVMDALKLPTEDYASVKGGARSWKVISEEDGFTIFTVDGEQPTKDAAHLKVKQFYETFGEGREIIFPDEFDRIKRHIEGINDNQVAKQLLSGDIKTELEFFGELDGLAVKCKIDLLKYNPEDDTYTILEYKTEDSNIRPWAIEKKCRKFGYDMQSWFYPFILEQNGIKIRDFTFIIQSKKSFECLCIMADKVMIADGEKKCRLAVDIIHRCQSTGEWPEFLDTHTGNTNRDAVFSFESFRKLEDISDEWS